MNEAANGIRRSIHGGLDRRPFGGLPRGEHVLDGIHTHGGSPDAEAQARYGVALDGAQHVGESVVTAGTSRVVVRPPCAVSSVHVSSPNVHVELIFCIALSVTCFVSPDSMKYS